MKCFHCTHCHNLVFFENNHCLKCGHALGFVPAVLELVALEPAPNDQWRAVGESDPAKTYRSCANGRQHGVCNWLVPSADPAPLCVACRLNEIIPDLTDAKNCTRWAKLELAKRRCIFTFLKLGLPLQSPPQQKLPSLVFRFLQDKPNAPVKTGHENGIITVNIAEADDDERERRRLNFHEPYRTLVGHFRHESGHFYWDRLIANSPHLAPCRALFGDDTLPYGVALQNYYKQGAPIDWASKTVTPYACAHPWEDWAETWAHYLHIVDTLESAASFRLSVTNTVADDGRPVQMKSVNYMDFDQMLTEWTPLVCALNAINRGMGLSDLYPFVLSAPVVEKLRFIHHVILENQKAPAPPAPA